MSSTIPCVYMRGGTSKACIFMKEDLPEDVKTRDDILLRAFGSPDPLQIDGMGGATPTTSKAAIVSISERDDADIDYYFMQVGIDEAYVDKGMNCGNISSAIGPFAVDQGLVPAVEPITKVRIYNVNTQKIIVEYVPVKNGRFDCVGEYTIDGVPGTGSKIRLEFVSPQGSATGTLLPTGHPIDQMDIDGASYDYSFVDAANPVVFLRAKQFGMRGDETPAEYHALLHIKEVRRKMEIIRGTCAITAGLAHDLKDAEENSQVLPKIIICAETAPDSGNIIARFISMKGKMSPTFAVTGGICTAVAANTPGTIVNEIMLTNRGKRADWFGTVKIAHPRGCMELEAVAKELDDGTRSLYSCILGRTARRIMAGEIYLP